MNAPVGNDASRRVGGGGRGGLAQGFREPSSTGWSAWHCLRLRFAPQCLRATQSSSAEHARKQEQADVSVVRL